VFLCQDVFQNNIVLAQSFSQKYLRNNNLNSFCPEGVCFSEISVPSYQITIGHNPEERNIIVIAMKTRNRI
jgi:hypothetical protein